MGSPLIKRLDALYQRAQMVMKVQADHTVPMVVAQRNVRRMSSGSVRKLRQVCIILTKI